MGTELCLKRRLLKSLLMRIGCLYPFFSCKEPVVT